MGGSKPFLKSLLIIVTIIFLVMAPRTTLAKAAGRGGSTRKVKNPLDEDDMGMPISHPYKKTITDL